MKIFQVDFEEDGITTKEQSKTITKVERVTTRYAAETIEQVWEEIKWIREDEERTIVGIWEVAPSIEIIK